MVCAAITMTITSRIAPTIVMSIFFSLPFGQYNPRINACSRSSTFPAGGADYQPAAVHGGDLIQRRHLGLARREIEVPFGAALHRALVAVMPSLDLQCLAD